MTLAAGVGSRWTTGAGVVKAVNPFAQLAGRAPQLPRDPPGQDAEARGGPRASPIPHVVTTSYLTHAAIEHHLHATGNYGHDGPVYLSRGRSIGQRLIPMTRDLTFLWEETSHETLDENKQKVREAGRRAILEWARGQGEGSDYTDNVPIQRFNPPGHFYEVPNLLRNGVLARLLDDYPRLNWLLVHNIDTLGANLDPGVLGSVIESGATLSFEVIPRRIDDRGGGLAKVGGRLRLLEGLAQPREDTEFKLRYYNTLTTWVRVDGLLDAFGLTRDDLRQRPRSGRRGRPRHGRPRPDLCHHQGRQAAMGPRAGRRLPGRPVREALGRPQLAPRPEQLVPGRRPPPRPAAQGRRAARRLGQRRQHGAHRVALPLHAMSAIENDRLLPLTGRSSPGIMAEGGMSASAVRPPRGVGRDGGNGVVPPIVPDARGPGGNRPVTGLCRCQRPAGPHRRWDSDPLRCREPDDENVLFRRDPQGREPRPPDARPCSTKVPGAGGSPRRIICTSSWTADSRSFVSIACLNQASRG